jgi:hypothetical protein
MRAVFATAAAFLLLTGAAFAQANTIVDPEKLPEAVALDQKYRNALKRLPDPENTNDPWRTVRSVEQADGKNKQASGKKTKAN